MSPTFGELAGFNMSRRTSLGGRRWGVCTFKSSPPPLPQQLALALVGGSASPPQQVALALGGVRPPQVVLGASCWGAQSPQSQTHPGGTWDLALSYVWIIVECNMAVY